MKNQKPVNNHKPDNYDTSSVGARPLISDSEEEALNILV